MQNESYTKPLPNQPMIYQIRVVGHLQTHWSSWFEGLAVSPAENGETLITGPVADQAVLHGLLRKVRDLGLPLLSVQCVESADVSERKNKKEI